MQFNLSVIQLRMQSSEAGYLLHSFPKQC